MLHHLWRVVGHFVVAAAVDFDEPSLFRCRNIGIDVLRIVWSQSILSQSGNLEGLKR